ncbi:DNA polymerase III subunit beta [Streptosporangium longisporum]|uniref:DNA polymerase III subunit beta n=1 Tax=Streptosporangium longisporum TaxID=46187 RepID=A0ABP6L261_9ACTN
MSSTSQPKPKRPTTRVPRAATPKAAAALKEGAKRPARRKTGPQDQPTTAPESATEPQIEAPATPEAEAPTEETTPEAAAPTEEAPAEAATAPEVEAPAEEETAPEAETPTEESAPEEAEAPTEEPEPEAAEPEAAPTPLPGTDIKATASPKITFEVARESFGQAVAWVAQSLPTRPSVPTLAGIRFDLGGGDLRLSAYDYEVSMKETISVDSQEETTLLLPGRLLNEIVRSLPDERVTIEVDGAKVILTCGPATFGILTMPVEDYPTLPEMPPVTGQINGGDIARAVSRVAVAAGKDDSLPMLTGVRVDINGGAVTLAATDRYRLAVSDVTWKETSAEHSCGVMVPARVLTTVAKAFSRNEVAISVADTGDGALLGVSSVGGRPWVPGARREMTTRLLAPDFPKYRSLIPEGFSGHADLPVREFTEALKRVALVAPRDVPVRLTFAQGQLTLACGSDEAESKEVLAVKWNGPAGVDPYTIAFNPAYLLAGVDAIGMPEVRLSVNNSVQPAILTGLDKEGEQVPGYLYLIMPIRLS